MVAFPAPEKHRASHLEGRRARAQAPRTATPGVPTDVRGRAGGVPSPGRSGVAELLDPVRQLPWVLEVSFFFHFRLTPLRFVIISPPFPLLLPFEAMDIY